jgi:hypothetical protein
MWLFLFRLRRKIEISIALRLSFPNEIEIFTSMHPHLCHKIDVSISIIAAASVDVIVSYIVITADAAGAEIILFAEIVSIQVFPNAHLCDF